MNQQISNYIRGKVTEIFIVGIASYITFAVMDLRYAVLLGCIGRFLGTDPPLYRGGGCRDFACCYGRSVPVGGISPDFWWLLVAYGIIQALDGNVLVPILFSEAVNLHPVAIIVAVLVFGGLWGFWGRILCDSVGNSGQGCLECFAVQRFG